MESSSLERLLRPRTIAVFGGKEARRVIEQCDRLNFAGDVWPVHPELEEVMGRKCYRSVIELPDVPDAAFVGVNRVLTIDIVKELSARGAGGAVCYASGYQEAVTEIADGATLQNELVVAAGAMPIIGPNCYGFINALDGALLWPDQHGLQRLERGVAIVTQSSNIAINLSMQRRALPIAYLLTAGNQAKISLSHLAREALEDPRVTAVGLHVEGFGDVRDLERLAARGRELGKPIVVLKVGKSDAARKATISHTASLAGSDAVATALLERLGIGRVHTLSEFMETLKLLHVVGPISCADVSSMSCSGGEASLMADAAVGRKVNFRPLHPEQLPTLRETLGAVVTLSNPLDYHTFVWGDLRKQTDAFAAMFSGGYAINLVVLDFPRHDRCDLTDWTTTTQAVFAAADKVGAVAGIVSSLTENMPEDIASQLMSSGIVPFCGIDEALAAIEIAAFIGDTWSRPPASPLLFSPGGSATAILLSEAKAKQELAKFGVTIPKGKTCSTPSEATVAAIEVGFPVVVKGLGLAHKTEVGAVKLNLKTTEEVEKAARGMSAVVDSFLIERMVEEPVAEFILGASRDPVVGIFLTIGAGGVLVDLLNDAEILLLPASRAEIDARIAKLRISALLDGYRGGPKGDFLALGDTIENVAAFVAANPTDIEELDINPLMVLAAGRGAVAADVLIKRRGSR